RHFPDRQALLDALAGEGFERLGTELRAAADGAGEEFEPRLRAIGSAYIRFATEDAALLDLIEQGQREGVLEKGEAKRVGLVLFATIQGIASLVSAGLVEPGDVNGLIADATERFLRGSRGGRGAGPAKRAAPRRRAAAVG